MHRSISRSGTAGFAAIALLIVLAVLASGVLGRSGDPTPSGPPPTGTPTISPSPAPSADPSPEPTPKPTAAPSDDGTSFDLDVPTPHRVRAIVDDRTGSLVGGRSGRPGDGMSVRWFDSIVDNVDDDTIRVTWVGLPQDDTVRITLTERDGKLHIAIDQSAPPANSDALGNDRVVEFDLADAVDADDVVVTVTQ